MKLWEGRFDAPTAADADVFNESLSFDKKLYRADITASVAHATMLGETNIIPPEEAALIVDGLKGILKDIDEGMLAVEGAEDIHSFVENELVKRIGEVGKKLHTARSRNDQVATDLRLYVRDSIDKLILVLHSFVTTLTMVAHENIKCILPGYTHLRRAQPVNLAQFLNAYSEMFLRDMERLEDCRKRVNVMPLGSAALAGTSFPIDRNITKKLLKFDDISNCSIDAVSDRDFVAEYLFCLTEVMLHLSRLSEDTILYTSDEFGFWEISDAYSTGSSIMPQKKNPDIPELIRGKCGRVIGDLTGFLATLKALPLAYDKDLQEDKEALFDAEKTVFDCVTVFHAMFKEMKFNSGAMFRAAEGGFSTATDVADYLSKKGVPFRDAHAITGKLVRYCLEHEKTLRDLSLKEFKAVSDVFERDVTGVVLARTSAESRDSVGGSSQLAARKALIRIRNRLKRYN